jgi:hypothetical protein
MRTGWERCEDEVFVGRGAELELLDDAYRRVALGESRLLSVEGLTGSPSSIGPHHGGRLFRAFHRRLAFAADTSGPPGATRR